MQALLLNKHLLATDYVNTSGEVLGSVAALNTLTEELAIDAVNVNLGRKHDNLSSVDASEGIANHLAEFECCVTLLRSS